MKTSIIICICWIIAAAITLIYRHRQMSPLEKFAPKWKNVLIDSILILLAPLMIIVLLIDFVRKRYISIRYKNKPRPLPEKMKKFLKKDCVLDEDNKTVSIAEYNYKHGTSYTIDDVYGKGYTDSLNEQDKNDVRKSEDFGILKIQENLPDSEYKDAAIILGTALLSGKFDKLADILDNEVSITLYGSDRHISGKAECLAYWREWRDKYVVTHKAMQYEVKHSNYNSRACFLVDTTIVMFMIKGGKVQKILLSSRSLNPAIGFHYDLLDLQMDNEIVRKHLTPLDKKESETNGFNFKNRIPCMDCGLESEHLEWHGFHFAAGTTGWSGKVSFCPHCHKMVEFYPEIRMRYDEPVGSDGIDDEDINEKRKVTTHYFSFHPDLMGVRNFYCSELLKGMKYFNGLPDNARKVAESFNFIALNRMVKDDKMLFDKIKNCYRAAANDSLYDAENNLGILALNFENREEEGRRLISDAAKHGSKDAMINMFTILWSDEKYSEAIGKLFDYSVQTSSFSIKQNASLRSLYNLAYLYYIGDELKGNIIKRSETITKELLEKILGCEGLPEHADEKEVFDKAKEFLKFLDNTNIYCEKGFQFHSLLRNRIAIKDDKKDKSKVFEVLKNIDLDDDWRLGLKLANNQTNKTGDESRFFLYNDKEGHEDDILKHLYVEPTEMGAWEVYLLMTSPTVMPTFWHGGYIERQFIFSKNDIYTIKPLRSYELTALVNDPNLLPSVTITKDWSDDDTRMNDLAYAPDPIADKWIADVYCCFWNEWKGLAREHVRITLRGATVEKYEDLGCFVIFPYHCGIWF